MDADGRRCDAGNAPSTVENRTALDRLTEKIISCAYTVGNTLGPGFLERVYENALAHELRKAGLSAEQQAPIDVVYDGVVMGQYAADILVGGEILIELKVARALDDVHSAQCLNYLKATGKRVCLLINFAKPKVEIRRLVSKF
jgi:GxxExxY protein